MNNESGENKIIDKTKEYAGKGFQILAVDGIDKKKTTVRAPLFKEMIFGFLFRIFVIVFFFLCGIRVMVIKRDPAVDFMAFWFFRIMGVALFFIALYLLYNTFAKKFTKETYVKWTTALIATIIVLIIISLSGGFESVKSLFNTIFIVFGR